MKRGSTWSFVVWAGDGPERKQVWRGGYRTKRDALTAERRFLIDVEDHGTRTMVNGPTVGEFLSDWLVQSKPTRRASTHASYVQCARDYVLPHLGSIGLRDLSPDDVRKWHVALLQQKRIHRAGTISPTTVRYCHRMVRRALQDALRWELIERNPLDAVKAPRAEVAEMTTWSPDEARQFLASVANDRLFAMWRLFLATGMRRGEVAGLRWIDVDLVVGRIAVRHTRVVVYDQAVVSEPKTRRSRRVVALDPTTIAALQAHRERMDAEALAFPGRVDSGYVFVTPKGNPLDPNDITRDFVALAEEAGVRRIRLHDLRHTAASLALATGMHPKVISDRLGHSSIAITMDTYGHLIPGLQEEAAVAVGVLLDAPQETLANTQEKGVQ